MAYTRFTNVEVTGDLKAKTLNVDGLTVDGVDDITPPTDAGDSDSKAQMQSLVTAVNGILAALGQTGD